MDSGCTYSFSNSPCYSPPFLSSRVPGVPVLEVPVPEVPVPEVPVPGFLFLGSRSWVPVPGFLSSKVPCSMKISVEDLR